LSLWHHASLEKLEGVEMAEIKFNTDMPVKAAEILTEVLENESLRLKYSMKLSPE
jgi:hypothetical protein